MSTNERLQWGVIGVLAISVCFGLWFGMSMYRLEMDIYRATVVHNQILKPHILQLQERELARQKAELQKQQEPAKSLPTVSGTVQ